MKKKLLSKGDIIMTNPEPGFYGIAVVLNESIPLELSPNRFSYPMNHIVITPLLYEKEITISDINKALLKPLIIEQYYLKNGKRYFWRNKLCIDIYTNRNKANLPIIGSVDTTEIYNGLLLWEPQDDRFHWCGDINSHLGREAYINYCRKNNITLE